MKIIKNFNSFISENVAEPIVKTKVEPKTEPKIEEPKLESGDPLDVIDRLLNIYTDLSEEDKKDLDKYFE